MLTRYRQNINSLFDDVLNWHNGLMQEFDGWFKPSLMNSQVNQLAALSEDTKRIYYTLDVPGISVDQLYISQEENLVKVQGERNVQGQVRTLSAQFLISPLAVQDTLYAQLENGVLTISFDKREPAAKQEPKKIEIKEVKSSKELKAKKTNS